VPDTPQRIATDTSQKLDVRYGGTMAAYGAQAADLTFIPLAVAVRDCCMLRVRVEIMDRKNAES
jgi:mannitol-1-phosphate/altronate dehydrogenase